MILLLPCMSLTTKWAYRSCPLVGQTIAWPKTFSWEGMPKSLWRCCMWRLLDNHQQTLADPANAIQVPMLPPPHKPVFLELGRFLMHQSRSTSECEYTVCCKHSEIKFILWIRMVCLRVGKKEKGVSMRISFSQNLLWLEA